MLNRLWPWIRAVAIFGVVLIAVLIWNPHFTIAGIWNPYQRSSYSYHYNDQRNAISVLVLGAAAIACVESVRRKRQ